LIIVDEYVDVFGLERFGIEPDGPAADEDKRELSSEFLQRLPAFLRD
jgi:hypothetical protein